MLELQSRVNGAPPKLMELMASKTAMARGLMQCYCVQHDSTVSSLH